MYIDSATKKVKSGKSYTRHLLRTSYREDGKVKHETILNLSAIASDEEIDALRLALKYKNNLNMLAEVDNIQIRAYAR